MPTWSIHLAFVIMGSREESARVNLEGTRNVFEATVAADRPRRLVYTSSVAAYGYHSDNPVPITEDVPVRGSPEHYYSEQKAACEAALAEITAGSSLEVFVLRPCIVAGPKAPALADAMPWNQLPGPVKRSRQALPLLKPPFPDPGTPLQLVHHDDVAAAIALAATTSAPSGAYNIAGGRCGVDVRCGRRRWVPVPSGYRGSQCRRRRRSSPGCRSFRRPLEWLHVGRTSVVMDATQGQDRSWAGPRNTRPPRRCGAGRDCSKRSPRRVASVGGPARCGTTFVRSVGALGAHVGFGGLRAVLVHSC